MYYKKATKFGSQNFGYQIWFCTRLLNDSPVYLKILNLKKKKILFRTQINHLNIIWQEVAGKFGKHSSFGRVAWHQQLFESMAIRPR